MKSGEFRFDIQVCPKEIAHLRKYHPVLLDQASEYGCEKAVYGWYFYNQPKRMVEEIKRALKDCSFMRLS